MTKPYIAVPVLNIKNKTKKKSSEKLHTNKDMYKALPMAEEVIPISEYKKCMNMAAECQGEIIDLKEELKKYENNSNSNRRCGIFGCGVKVKKGRKGRKTKKRRKRRKTRKGRKTIKTKRKLSKRIGRKR